MMKLDIQHGEEVLDELFHYGVMGMKWGVRRDQRTLDKAANRPISTKRRGARAQRVQSNEDFVKKKREYHNRKAASKVKTREKDRAYTKKAVAGVKDVSLSRSKDIHSYNKSAKKQNKQIDKINKKRVKEKGHGVYQKKNINRKSHLTGQKLTDNGQLGHDIMQQYAKRTAISLGTGIAVRQAFKYIVNKQTGETISLRLDNDVFNAEFLQTVVPKSWSNPVTKTR